MVTELAAWVRTATDRRLCISTDASVYLSSKVVEDRFLEQEWRAGWMKKTIITTRPAVRVEGRLKRVRQWSSACTKHWRSVTNVTSMTSTSDGSTKTCSTCSARIVAGVDRGQLRAFGMAPPSACVPGARRIGRSIPLSGFPAHVAPSAV